MSSETKAKDAVEFLIDQHNQVKALFEQITNGLPTERRQPFEAVVRALAVHETAEEEVVWPVVRQRVPNGDTLAKRRMAEEDQAKKALSGLEKVDPASTDFGPLFARVRDIVLEHATHEEREVFPLLREHQTPDMLDAMRKAIIAAEATAPTHPHANAPESAVGNMVMGPFVAVADRVRDALRGSKKQSP
jgi:hemerythrin superfamily protein